MLRCAAGMLLIALMMGAAYTTTAMASSIGLIDTADLLDIHAEADGSSDVVGQVMDEGHVAILARADGWVQIKAGEIVGWVPQENLIETEVSNEEAHAANQKVIAEIAEEAMEAAEDTEEEAAVAFAQEVHAENAHQADAVLEEEMRAAEEEAQRAAEAEAQRLAAEAEAQRLAAEAEAQRLAAEAQRLAAEEAQRLAAEEAQRQAQALAEAQKQAVLASAGVSEEDLYLLANIIYCEAGGEPYVGKVAVGNVVMNRVKSSKYPDSIKEVVYDRGQFSPVGDGNLKRALKHNKANEDCYQAAMEALAGAKPVGDKLFFRRCNGRSGQVIGHHVFY